MQVNKTLLQLFTVFETFKCQSRLQGHRQLGIGILRYILGDLEQ